MEEIAIDIPATMRGLTTALAKIEQFCAVRNLYSDQVARIRVVAEELVTNTIKYGYGGESERPVHLRLRAGAVLTLIYEDHARPFDPTRWRRETAPAAAHREGRAGIDLILGLSSTVAYEGGPEWNRLTLTFASDTGACA